MFVPRFIQRTTTNVLRRRSRQALSTPAHSNAASSTASNTHANALEKWSDDLNDEQKDKLLDELLKNGKLQNDMDPTQRRAAQQEMLRQLAGQSMLRDNATGWSSDAQSSGHFFPNGSTPVSIGWEGIENDVDEILFPCEEDSDGEESQKLVGEEDEEADDFEVSLLIFDTTKSQQGGSADSDAEAGAAAAAADPANTSKNKNKKMKKIRPSVTSRHDSNVLTSGMSTTEYMSLPDVYRSKADLSMWNFLKESKNIDKTVESYNDVMDALFHHGDWRRAKALFDTMEMEALDDPALTPTIETYNVVLRGMFTTKSESNIDEAIRLYDIMPSMGYERNAGTFEAVIEGLIHHGKIDDALDLFYMLHRSGSVDVRGEEENKDAEVEDHHHQNIEIPEEIPEWTDEDLLSSVRKETEEEEEEKDDDITMTTKTYNLVLNVLGGKKMEKYTECWRLFEEMGDQCPRDVETYNYTIRNLCFGGHVERARGLFDSMPEVEEKEKQNNEDDEEEEKFSPHIPAKNQHSYDAMLDGLSLHNMTTEIQTLLSSMTARKGLKKNTWPFIKKIQKTNKDDNGRGEAFYQKVQKAW